MGKKIVRSAAAPVRWLSTEEAAHRIGMSRFYVRERIEAGVLPARAWQSGNRVIYRIHPDDLDAFIEQWSFSALDAALDEPREQDDS